MKLWLGPSNSEHMDNVWMDKQTPNQRNDSYMYNVCQAYARGLKNN